MLIWGGTKFELAENQSPYLDTGGRYDPVTDSWEPTSTSGAPSRRSSAKSVWTGDSLFVWGGLGWYYSLSTGGLYHLVVPKTFYQDSDGDGFGNSGATTLACSVPADFVANATDCSDADGSVWSTPTEALDLRWTDPATLVWSPPASPGADQIRYDVLRSPTPSNFNAAAVCAATDTPNATLTEPSVPSLQQTLYYLARAENNCPAGSGPLGSGTNGAARSGLACP
jgi:hypothetical protein